MTQPSPNSVTTPKEMAREFLRMAASTNVREAFSRYVGPHFRHHNAFFRGDAESLMVAMEENAIKHPDKTLTIHHVLEDGPLVAIYSQVHLIPGDRGVALMHIFRFHENRIAELWDIGQPVPPDMPNENGMF